LIGAITNHVLSTPPELFSQMQANGPAYVDSLIDFVLAGARASGRAVPETTTPPLTPPAPSSNRSG
jgi:hypothetical protein